MSNFNIYDGLLFTSKPDLGAYGLKQIKSFGPQSRFGDLSKSVVTDLAAKQPSSLTQETYYIDIENLPTSFKNSDLDKAESMIKLMSIIHAMKTERPTLNIGFYAILPEREYWHRTEEWKNRNDYYKPLAEFVDYVSPSLYTFYDDQLAWVQYAIENINEAKKYNKPIYPFIWPQYHPSSALAGQLIPGDYWRLQLQTMQCAGADGVIIWGGWQIDWTSSISETDHTNWWYQTLDFNNY